MISRGFLFILFYLASGTLFSQQYKPMLEGTKEWTLLTCNGTQCTIDSYRLGKDTLLGGTHYRVIDGYHFIGSVLIREDTLTQRVYLKAIGFSPLSPEILTYDFSLNVGDSMRITNTQAPIPDDGGFFHVDSVKHIDYLGTKRKTMYLSGNDTSKKDLNRAIWVEGIGSLSIINAPGLYPNHEGTAAIICSHKDGKMIYRFTSGRIDSCVVTYVDNNVSVNEPTPREQMVTYPNPNRGSLHIKFPKSMGSSYRIELIDMLGNLQLEKNINSQSISLDISSLADGQYILQIFDSAGSVSRNRIVLLKEN